MEVMQDLARLYKFRELLWIWILREIRIRYKQSYLGATWAILQPLSMMLVFTVVFSVLARLPSDGIPYSLFSYTALLPWTFFSTAISFGSASLINNMNLVTKADFPREILPMGAIGAGFIDYLVASSVYITMIIYYRVEITLAMLWVPVILIVQIALTSGVVLITSALTVYFRDVRFIVPLGIQIWFFLSPVIYSSSLIPDRLRAIYMVNPMAGIIESYRQVILFGRNPVPEHLFMAVLSAGLVSVVGYRLFKRMEKVFPDII